MMQSVLNTRDVIFNVHYIAFIWLQAFCLYQAEDSNTDTEIRFL